MAQYRKALRKARRFRASVRRARANSARHAARGAEVERFCFFLGFPRSGTSLVGQLLNAHRHIVISHESDVVRFIESPSTTRAELFSLIVEKDLEFIDRGASGAGGYEFAVPGQWQGSTERLRVLGDKKASASASRLARNPELLGRLRDVVGVPLRVVTVVRNPYDNIATMAKRSQSSLDAATETYFGLADDVAVTSARLQVDELHRLRMEDLTDDPRGELARLCAFLGVDAPVDYIDACVSIVFEAPRRTRTSAPWTPALIANVERRIAGIDFLAGYTYDT